jgi:hypothetical protein
MVYFQTKSPNLGDFWRVLQWKMLAYFMDNWFILQPFGVLYGHLAYFLVIWCIFPHLVCCTKKNLATLITARHAYKRIRAHANVHTVSNVCMKEPAFRNTAFKFLFKMLGGWEANFNLFSHFHHFTAEPQWLPKILLLNRQPWRKLCKKVSA